MFYFFVTIKLVHYLLYLAFILTFFIINFVNKTAQIFFKKVQYI